MILKVPYSISKIINKVKAPFQQGLNTYDLLTAIVVAISLSMFPLIGTTTMLIVAMGLWLKLNLPVMIIMGYISSAISVFIKKY